MNQERKNAWRQLSNAAKYNVFARFVKARNARAKAAPYVGPKKGNPARLNKWWIKNEESLPGWWRMQMKRSPHEVGAHGRRRLMDFLKSIPGQVIYRDILNSGHTMPPEMWDNLVKENRESAVWEVNFTEKNKVPVASASNANMRAFLKLNVLMTEPTNQMRAFYMYVMDPGTNLHVVRTTAPRPVKQNTRAVNALWNAANNDGPKKKKRVA